MNKIIFSLLFTSTIFACEHDIPKIMSYNSIHKEAVLTLAFEDALKFFGGSEVVIKGHMTPEQFNAENKKNMEIILENPQSIIHVLVLKDKVVGFVEFNKTREHSIEGMMRQMVERGLPCNEQQLAAAMPQMKLKDAECKDYALVECLAVSKDARGKGYGKALLQDAVEKIKQQWPSLKQARLTVNESNTVARKLYEKMGFVANPNQLPYLTMMKIVEYQKEL